MFVDDRQIGASVIVSMRLSIEGLDVVGRIFHEVLSFHSGRANLSAWHRRAQRFGTSFANASRGRQSTVLAKDTNSLRFLDELHVRNTLFSLDLFARQVPLLFALSW